MNLCTYIQIVICLTPCMLTKGKWFSQCYSIFNEEGKNINMRIYDRIKKKMKSVDKIFKIKACSNIITLYNWYIKGTKSILLGIKLLKKVLHVKFIIYIQVFTSLVNFFLENLHPLFSYIFVFLYSSTDI